VPIKQEDFFGGHDEILGPGWSLDRQIMCRHLLKTTFATLFRWHRHKVFLLYN
jgi:hypothetical protein